MHRFLMKVKKFGNGYEAFEIDATDKTDAVRRGLVYVRQNPHYHRDVYDLNDVKCIKKLKSR